jgi:hypothetical protein
VNRGLAESELSAIEATFGFRFPIDLRALLAEGPTISQWDISVRAIDHLEAMSGERLRAGDDEPIADDVRWGWMNWRAPREEIAARLAEPLEPLIERLRDTEYWLPQWGERPSRPDDRLKLLAAAPVLIPIGGSRYMPAEPHEAGNPIYSIVGLDMIVAGCDLADYLDGGLRSMTSKGASRRIHFWSDVLYAQFAG